MIVEPHKYQGFVFNFMKRFNLIGQKFNRLTVIEFAYMRHHSYWKCKCKCNQIIIARGTHLIDGNIKSCGCLSLGKTNPGYKHGLSKTKFYKTWAAIKVRCLNKNNYTFQNYGARGITICNRWLKFENFRDDMYKSYKEHVKKFGQKQTTIERTNNNGNYCKSNCEWATYKQQNNNSRNNHSLTYKGQTLTITQWAKKLNFKKYILINRISIYKWSIPRAFTTPVQIHKK